MIDEKKLIKKLECHRWKMASDTTPMQSLEVKFGNEMLDMILCVVDNQPEVQQIARTPEEIAHLLYKFRKNDVNCIDCNAFGICENHADDDYSCEEVLVEWLTKKEV